MSEFLNNRKYQSLILIGILLLFIAIVYNFSLMDMHKSENGSSNSGNGLLVPSYNQNSYVSEKNKLNSMVYHIDGEDALQSSYENRKKKRMDISNLCYHDVINDDINIALLPVGKYITP